MKQDEYSTANQLWNAGNSWTPVGPNKDRSSGPSQFNWKFYAGAIIKSEARPTSVQLKRSATLLTTKHAVCRTQTGPACNWH